MTRKAAPKRSFGNTRELPSGRWQARYTGPDGRVYKASRTFAAKLDADSWLVDRRREIDRELWSPDAAAEEKAKPQKVTFQEFADKWVKTRKVNGEPLKARTREHYEKILDQLINPALGSLPIGSITPDDIESWHNALGDKRPTLNAHAYSLVRTIFATAALPKGPVTSNPAQIRGAGTAKRVHKIRPASLPELQALTNAMPENQRALILLASWCALRFGELTELRRKDIVIPDNKGADAVRHGAIRVRRAVVRVGGAFVVTTPKSDAGIRDVAIPPHLIPVIENHLAEYVGREKDSLLFPALHGGHLAPATLYRQFYKARAAAGRDDLRFHDLRHSGAVLAAATGATLAELMARLGHSTPAAAMRYQHAAQGRDRQIAALLSKLAIGS